MRTIKYWISNLFTQLLLVLIFIGQTVHLNFLGFGLKQFGPELVPRLAPVPRLVPEARLRFSLGQFVLGSLLYLLCSLPVV